MTLGVYPRPSPESRFWMRVNKTETCWLWKGNHDKDGYGILWVDGHNVRAHRFSYELLKNKIPAGLVVDHICQVPYCVNPNHLELVTMEENTKRGFNRPPKDYVIPLKEVGRIFGDDIRRFWSKVEKTESCWLWMGTRNQLGYGSFWFETTMMPAHRFSYQLMKGPIPDGLDLDHLCRNPPCVNPDHLEAVTPRENALRGDTVAARNAKKTHCPKGHPYSLENTYLDGGKRRCRICLHEKRTSGFTHELSCGDFAP